MKTDFHFANRLPQLFFAQATTSLTEELVGTILVKNDGETLLAGRIVETEAYLARNDAASHSFRGKTPRNEAMFGEAGTLYVYRIYGIHLCVNVVSEAAGIGAAVLLRAIKPLQGLDLMRNRRGVEDIRALCNGPGNLTKAFGFTLGDNFLSCRGESCFLLPRTAPVSIGISARVGITKDAALPLRFFEKGSGFVSKGKPSA